MRDCSTVRLAATSSIRTDSVISSERRWGLSPESARVVATSSLRWAAPIWRADRLTATLSGGRSGNRRFQSATWRQDRSSTNAPRGRISPVSSATGMNSAGAISPRAGWFQRTRASTPTILVVARRTIG